MSKKVLQKSLKKKQTIYSYALACFTKLASKSLAYVNNPFKDQLFAHFLLSNNSYLFLKNEFSN